MSEETATVETKEIPIGESSMAEFKKARAEGKDVVERSIAPPATEEEVATTTDDPTKTGKPKTKGGFQARIDRLVKQQAVAEERATAAERRAQEAEAKLNGAPPKTDPKTEQTRSAAPTEPKREDFQTEAEYGRALTRWEVKQELKAEREEEEKAASEAAAKEAVANYNKRAIEAQAKYEDWEQVFKQDINIPVIVGDAIVHTIKNGPDVAYFLGKHPDICEEMVSVHPLEAVAMAVKISERLEAETPTEEEETEEEIAAREAEEQEKTAAEEAKKRTRAPAPIRPVTGGSTRSTIPLAKTDFQTYKKLRAQGRVQ